MRALPSNPATSCPSVPLRFIVRVLATLLLALAAAGVCLALHTPLPWMIGPLIAVSLASIAGLPTASHTPLRNAGQWTIGTALGLYFTPHVVSLVASVWWAIVLAIAWALLLGTGFFLVFGALSDKIGRKPIILAGCLIGALTLFPIFRMITTNANPTLEKAIETVKVEVVSGLEEGETIVIPGLDLPKAQSGGPMSMTGSPGQRSGGGGGGGPR